MCGSKTKAKRGAQLNIGVFQKLTQDKFSEELIGSIQINAHGQRKVWLVVQNILRIYPGYIMSTAVNWWKSQWKPWVMDASLSNLFKKTGEKDRREH